MVKKMHTDSSFEFRALYISKFFIGEGVIIGFCTYHIFSKYLTPRDLPVSKEMIYARNINVRVAFITKIRYL